MELTDTQIERQDFVDNTIYEMLIDLIPSEKSMHWDIDSIGRVRDVIAQVFVEKNLCSEQEFYPYIPE